MPNETINLTINIDGLDLNASIIIHSSKSKEFEITHLLVEEVDISNLLQIQDVYDSFEYHINENLR